MKNTYSLAIKKLEKGWHDKDEVLIHAAFQLLTDFIELEQPQKIVDWSYDAGHRKAWKEMTSARTNLRIKLNIRNLLSLQRDGLKTKRNGSKKIRRIYTA